MKFVKFPEMNGQVPVVFDGEDLPFFSDGQGNIVLCAEVDKDDLKVIRDNGKIYIMMIGFEIPPPIGVIATNPFKDHANKNKKGPGDNEQPDSSDSKLSVV